MTMGIACDADRSPGEAGLSLNGRAQLVSASGRKTSVFRDQTVHRGETVRVTKGTATLELSDDRRIELRQGSTIKIDRTPTLQGGDALLVAGATRLLMRSAGSSVSVVNGAARLRRALGLEAATYKGTVNMTSTGRVFHVPELRQATIPSLGVVPDRAEPLRMRAADAWDRRFLGEAMELTEQLQARSDGLTGQLPAGQGRSAGFVAAVVPELAARAGFDPSLVDGTRTPGESVVGASIAAAGHGAPLAERWRAVFSFRDEGAAWGLVALDQGVTDAANLSSTVDNALALAHDFTVQMAAPTTSDIEAAQAAAAAAAAGDKPAATPAPAQKPTTGPTGPPPALPAAEPDAPPGPLQPVVDTVGDLLGGLVDGLGAK